MGGFSLWHILIFAIILLLLFGGNRFSAMMGDVAKGLKSFKEGMSEEDEAKQQEQQRSRPASARAAPDPAARRRRSTSPRTRRARATAPPRRRRATTARARPGRTMFGVDTSELLIVAVLALLFIGPKDLPRAMMMVGRWVGKVRGYARHFTAGIENVVREAELEEMEQNWRKENQRILAQYPADAHYPEPVPARPRRRADDRADRLYEDRADAPARSPRRARRRSAPSALQLSGRCHDRRYRRQQGAVARPSDRASPPLAVVRRDADGGLLRLPLFRQADLRGARPAIARGGAGQADLHRRVRGLFRRGEGRLLRRADDQLPGPRDADLAVRRARHVRQGKARLPAVPADDAVLLRGRRGLRLFLRHAVGAEVPARLSRAMSAG